MNPASDRIERKILLKAPRSQVWRVLANAEAFGQWFGVALELSLIHISEPTRPY